MLSSDLQGTLGNPHLALSATSTTKTVSITLGRSSCAAKDLSRCVDKSSTVQRFEVNDRQNQRADYSSVNFSVSVKTLSKV